MADRTEGLLRTLGAMIGAMCLSYLGWAAASALLIGRSPAFIMVYFAVSVALTYRVAQAAARWGSLSLGNCRITKPRLSIAGLAVITVVVWARVALTTSLPGRWTYGGMDRGALVYSLCFILFVSGFRSGICEEMIYRGVILRAAEQQWGAPLAVLISSVMFDLLHGSLHPMRLLLALICALLTLGSGHIWDAALFHAVWNTVNRIYGVDAAPGTVPLNYLPDEPLAQEAIARMISRSESVMSVFFLALIALLLLRYAHKLRLQESDSGQFHA